MWDPWWPESWDVPGVVGHFLGALWESGIVWWSGDGFQRPQELGTCGPAQGRYLGLLVMALSPSGFICCILLGTFHAFMRGKHPYWHIKAPRGFHECCFCWILEGLFSCHHDMTPAGLNICWKHVEEWSGLEALLLLSIIPGSVFRLACQHSNCVGLAAATVILISVWCFWAPEDSTTSTRSPPSCHHPDCFQVQKQSWGVRLSLSCSLALDHALALSYLHTVHSWRTALLLLLVCSLHRALCRRTFYGWLKYHLLMSFQSPLLFFAKRVSGLT